MAKITYTINTALTRGMTLGEVFKMARKIETGGGAKAQGIDRDLGFAVQYVRNELLHYRISEKCMTIKVEDFYRMRKIANEDFIHIHRMNYLVWYVIQSLFAMVEDRGLMKFNVKKHWKSLQRVFQSYQAKHKDMLDIDTWSALLDNMRLVYDEVSPRIEPFESAIRDYLIQKRSLITGCGQKDDIALLSKIYLSLLFCAALRNTRRNFFRKQYEQIGVDFGIDFAFADVDSMCTFLVLMMRSVGVKFHKDSDGDDVPDGVDIAQSVRVDCEWNKIIRIVTDADLMDDLALEAINKHPKVKEGYDAIIAKQEAAHAAAKAKRDEEDFNNALELLRQQPNVKRL